MISCRYLTCVIIQDDHLIRIRSEIMSDGYQELAQYYDEFVQQNRDYPAIATHLMTMIGDRQKLLDIGIGTGLIVEHLLQAQPTYKITGIDTSQSLLDLAQKRLGDKVQLHCQSVADFDLDQVFEAAYSRGGAWTFVRNNGEMMLASHILASDAIQASFQRVAQHLQVGGLLIISSSNAYGDNMVNLENGIVHERVAKTEIVDDQTHAVLDYSFRQGQQLLAQQTLRLRLLQDRDLTPMLTAVGFEKQPMNSDAYCVYIKH